MSTHQVSILGWLGFALTVLAMIVGATLYISKVNAEQDRMLAEHEVRLRAVEEAIQGIQEQRSLLERILEAVRK